MNFWQRERFPFLPAVATPIGFQPMAPHFNNPAWELPQTMIASPFFAAGLNHSGPWAHISQQQPSPSTEVVKDKGPWVHEPTESKEKGEFKAGKIAQFKNDTPRSRRSNSRERSRDRDDRTKDRDRRRRSKERRSAEKSDDSPRRGLDKNRDRRDHKSRDDGKYSRDTDRRRDRSPIERRGDDGERKSRFSNRAKSPSVPPKPEEVVPMPMKPSEGDNKYSLEAANYKTQTPNETIMIRGLAQHITENDIRQDIVQCGLLPKDIRLIRKKETGVSRGFAFVEFNSSEEALCWMELKQGVLMLQDMYRAIMQFSIVAGDGNVGSWHPTADWDCPKCYAHNFKKRTSCYKCQGMRPDPSDPLHCNNEISPHPTTKLMIQNLDPLTNEENLLKEVSAVSDISIQSCQISREMPTNLSRGVCYLEMKNVLEAIKLYNELTARPFAVQGKTVSVCYCKLQPDKVAAPTWPAELQHQAQQQYSLADVPQLAEYSARMFAANPSQKAAFIQYYTQYYTNQINQQLAHPEGAITDTNSAAAVAQSAIQMAQTKKAVLASAAASAMSAAAALSSARMPGTAGYLSSQQIIGNTSIGEPDASQYVYDESSGYYFDQKTGLYYDVPTQYFYHSQDHVYLYWDKDKKAYMPAPTDGSAKPEDGKEDKKKEKDKQPDKVKVAKRIAKDMERWAKTLNQKKEVARQSQVAVQQAQSAAKSAATADIAFAVLERREVGQLDLQQPESPTEDQGALVASYGGGSDSEEGGEELAAEDQFHTDWTKMACLLCKRQFPTKEALQRHQQLSDLHKQNLDAWYRSRDMEPPAQRDAGGAGGNYRDRAHERRQKFGVPDAAKPSKLKAKYMKAQVETISYEEPSRAGIPSGNVGSKMLQKMGWSEGMGLGKTNQGRTDIVQAVQRVSTAGLGVAGSSLGPAGTANTYKENVRRAAMARFSELTD